ncbi:Ribonuclease T2 [Mactra antiquata]
MKNLCTNSFGLFVCMWLVTLCASQTEWDYFTLAQSWPPGNCIDAKREHHVCNTSHIDERIKTWTVHGLWPSAMGSKGPSFCDNTTKFNATQINCLMDNLTIYWPNLYKDTNLTSLWQHEWLKHGTCCQDNKDTSGEFNYFAAALMLNQKYNITRMLMNHGVVPSTTVQYSIDDFVTAIKKEVGYTPVVNCAAKKMKNGTTYHLISQLEICLSKDFTPRSCDSGYQPIRDEINELYNNDGHWWHHNWKNPPQSTCPKKYKFSYPPIHQTPE